jgi:hypothetical protein
MWLSNGRTVLSPSGVWLQCLLLSCAISNIPCVCAGVWVLARGVWLEPACGRFEVKTKSVSGRIVQWHVGGLRWKQSLFPGSLPRQCHRIVLVAMVMKITLLTCGRGHLWKGFRPPPPKSLVQIPGSVYVACNLCHQYWKVYNLSEGFTC